MDSLSPGGVEHHRGYEDFIPVSSGPSRKVFLHPRVSAPGDWEIILAIYPGDTVAQAREMFNSIRRDDLLALTNEGWKVVPNLHFAFIQRHLHWCESKLSTRDYVDFWLNNRDKIRQFQREEFERLFETLLDRELISEGDVPELKRYFTDTNRNSLNLCPGLTLHWSWPKGQAIDLDTGDRFKDEVRSRAIKALATWGQSPPW